MDAFKLTRGDSPVLLAVPHAGTWMPAKVLARLNARGAQLLDADWHVDKLYEGLLPGAGMIKANFHRYLIDANRAPDDASLYPGMNTTGLCPIKDFDGEPIWHTGNEPDATETIGRKASFHAPYHKAIRAELMRLRKLHGVALLFDCHSIRSRLPFLFEGELPVFNIGSNDGATSAALLEQAVCDVAGESGFSFVLNGRFKGGWTTRRYGRPKKGIHALQLEIAQRAYLDEGAPQQWDASAATALRAVLKKMLSRLEQLVLEMKQ